VNHALYADLLRHLPASDGVKLSIRLEQAETDAARLTALRDYAGQLGAIIGTSRYWCDNWWADAVAPGYGTIVHADTELKAAIAALTRLACHRQLQTIVGELQVGERGVA
jgi:hypothetical protein